MKNYLKTPAIIITSALMITIAIFGVEGLFKTMFGSNQLITINSYQENSEIELLAITPEGTKIYKIKHEKMIVPIILSQSTNGHIAIR